MRSLALFLLLFIIFYGTYFIMVNKLNITQNETIIKYKEVPKTLIAHQYEFDTLNYFNEITEKDNLWKEPLIN
jgi:hypothetical protein